MKKKLNLIFGLFAIMLIIVISQNKTTIITTAKTFEAGNEEVTDRDLALLASLAYENVPDDKNYDSGSVTHSLTECSYVPNSNGYLGWKETTGKCYFKTIQEETKPEIARKPVFRYIEGMSERKKNLLTMFLTAKTEPGFRYYFLESVPEEQYADWYVNNYYYKNSAISIQTTSGIWQGQLYAITFKKGNNYVISYRGTDFPDALEWLIDFSYLSGTTEQSEYAYNYAQSEYRRILAENPNANIYVTGHSLGAYLAQIGGAAINDLDKNKTNKNLEKVVYFNGMGIDLLAFDFGNEVIGGKTLKQLGDLLINLATTPANSSKNSNTCIKKINWSYDDCSSGRLVLYRTDGDIVSGLGLHYGEIREVKASADAISNHVNFHGTFFSRETLESGDRISASIKNFILTYIIKDDSTNDVKYDEKKLNDGTFSEQVFSTVSLFSNAASNPKRELSVDDFSDRISNKLDPNKTGFLKTGINALGDVAEKVFEYAKDAYATNDGILANVIEAVNIGHETDSLVCLIDGNEGIPEIKDIYSSEPFKIDEITGLRTYYTNKSTIMVEAQTHNGCIYNYKWSQKNSNNSLLDGKSNKLIISRPQSDRTVHYQLKADYGNEIATKSLNIPEQKYDYINIGEPETIGTGTITKEFAVKFDKTAPICTISKEITTVPENGKVNFSLNCNEEVDDGQISIYRNSLLGKEYISGNISCKDKKCSVSLHGEERGILTGNNLKHGISMTVTDFAGNKSKNIEIKNVKWVKTESSSSSKKCILGGLICFN